MNTLPAQSDALLDIRDLAISFKTDEGKVRAVDGVSISVKPGQIIGVVGESGSGKSVTMQSILRILPGNAIVERGEILLRQSRNGSDAEVVDVTQINPNSKRMRSIRGGEVAMIFQEPTASFSPVYTIGNQMMEAILLHRDVNKPEARTIAIDMLARVGISNPERRIDQYPFEFSGGMRQRAMIALALSCNPSLLIADEPTTALDVTIQAQVLELMKDLQRDLGMAILFITHNLGVIAQIAEEIVVMYLGTIVEKGPTREIFHNPKHPYTVNLLKAIPKVGQSRTRLAAIEGNVPSPLERPTGCIFHTRCSQRTHGTCDVYAPKLTQIGPDHTTSCFLYE